MASQYQQPQGQYYPPQQAVEKGHAMGAPPQNMDYNPGQQQQFAYANGHNPAGYGHAPSQPAVYPQHPPGAPASSGVKRSSCVALMAALLVLIAAVIGLSAGLGVSQRNLRNAQGDLARATESPATAAATATTTVVVTARPTGTSTSSSASATATPDTSNITCPGSNNTLYTADAPGSRQFRQYCGIDFSGDQAVDVGSVKATSMDACMDACASQSNCTGAGWGYLEGDNGTEHSCWMKANLTDSHEATAEWAFAILLGSNGSDAAPQRRRRAGGKGWWLWGA